MTCRGKCGQHRVILATYGDVRRLLLRHGLPPDTVPAKRLISPAPLCIVNALDSEYKRCRPCRIYMRWAGNRCPCCGASLSVRSRTTGAEFQACNRGIALNIISMITGKAK